MRSRLHGACPSRLAKLKCQDLNILSPPSDPRQIQYTHNVSILPQFSQVHFLHLVREMNDKTKETHERHLVKLILSNWLQVVTSPPVHEGWQVAAGCWVDTTSNSDSRTKTTASPLTFIRHCAYKNNRTCSVTNSTTRAYSAGYPGGGAVELKKRTTQEKNEQRIRRQFTGNKQTH